ncbi:hypothetical protein ABZ656_06090 [Streptomyces sp. NPDC007095]|uniref:hypothetical protein n=1 Tax=Streptomyces sp. NPDC007095 TaxID=3154482 RepID=UPI0033F4F57F
MDTIFDLPETSAPEQAVIARFRLSGEEFGERAERAVIFHAERAMVAAVGEAGVGEVDGDEFGGGEAVVYAYGPDAEALFKVMEPILRGLPFRPAHVVLRHGAAKTELHVDL